MRPEQRRSGSLHDLVGPARLRTERPGQRLTERRAAPRDDRESRAQRYRRSEGNSTEARQPAQPLAKPSDRRESAAVRRGRGEAGSPERQAGPSGVRDLASTADWPGRGRLLEHPATHPPGCVRRRGCERAERVAGREWPLNGVRPAPTASGATAARRFKSGGANRGGNKVATHQR